VQTPSCTARAKQRSTFVYDDGLRSYKTTKPFEGVIGNIERRWRETDSDWVREELSLPVGHACEACDGYRLKPEALAVKIATASTSAKSPNFDPRGQ
jgi:excinuclease ABC subunit A